MAEHALTSDAIAMSGTKEDALEHLVREHARLVYRIAYSTLRHHQDAEDAVQDTFLRIFRHRNKLSKVENPKTWIAKIAWRVAVERSRRRPSAARWEPLDDAMPLALHSNSAEEALLQRESSEVLGALIVSLPEQLRDAVVLSTVHELTTAEIADVLGVSESSVRSRLFRARALMKDKLVGWGGRHERKQ